MKHADLKVGEEYYYSRRADWMDGHGGHKAAVVDDKRYRRTSTFRNVCEDPKGNLVHVFVYRNMADSDSDSGWREFVPSTQLRGPWAETSKQVEEARARRREQEQQACAFRTQASERREEVRQAARELGLRPWPAREVGRVGIDVEALAAALHHLKQCGWKYQPEGEGRS